MLGYIWRSAGAERLRGAARHARGGCKQNFAAQHTVWTPDLRHRCARLRLSWVTGARARRKIAVPGTGSKYLEEHDIGPDALDISWEDFRERVGGRRGGLKSALMDQSVLSGLGNVYVDEILFQRRLAPKSSIGDLDEDELRAAYDEMGEVLKVAIDSDGDPEQLPDDFLLAHRH